MSDRESRERIQAIFQFVTLIDVGWFAAVQENFKHFGAPRSGHLILTTHRLAYIRSFKSQRVRERVRGLLSPTVMTEGWEDYQLDDLLQDIRERRNLDIPLATIQTIKTSGRNDSWLELDLASVQGTRRLRGAHIGGWLRITGSLREMPLASGESMVPIADAIQSVKRGLALELEQTS